MRFPQFAGEWEGKKLGEVCRMQAGKFISASEISDKQNNDLFPCYGGNGLRGYTKSFNQDGIYSLIGRQGALCGNITLADGRFYTTEHAVVVTPNNNIDVIWMFYLLTYLNLNQYATGMAQPGLSVKNLEEIEAIFPKAKIEQTKIASFLTLIDERISAQSKIIEGLKELKASLSKQLFSRKLQFKDDEENDFPEWVEKKLEYTVSQFIVPMRDKPQDLTGDIPWCRIEDFNGKHLYTSKSGQGVDISTVKEMSLKIYPIDTLLVSCSANLGVCAITKKELVTNQTFIGLVPDKIKIDVEYLYYIMTLSSIKLNTLSSGTTISYLSREEFEKFKIPYPCLQEQKKIANFLSNIDSKIEVETSTLEFQKKQKQYLLRQMFI